MNWWNPSNWTSEGAKSSVAMIAAVGALVGFASFVRYMLGHTSANETEWTRAVYLFSGVEMMAFAAAGFFFGSKVQRERAEKAEQRADKAEQKAGKGKALADLVKTKAQTSIEKAARTKFPRDAPSPEQPEESLAELAAFVNRFFPDQ